MKFTVEVVSRLSGRIGQLVQTETGQKFQTPLLLQTTKGGSIPHLSREVFKYITDEPQILEICLATTDHMEDALNVYERGLASFVGFPECLTFVTVKDPCEKSPSGFHSKEAVPFFTRRGKRELTADSYMNIVEAFRPHIYQALCDSATDPTSSKKRVIKSVDRTENIFKVCLERHRKSEKLKNSFFMGPVVGGYCQYARKQSVKFISEYPEVDGYVIEGLHSNGETATKLNSDSLLDIVSFCVRALATGKPKMMMGAYSPLTVLKLIQLGVDIFDTSFVYLSSTNNQALVFDYDLGASSLRREMFVDLSNESFVEDFTPIMQDCSCLCCRKHTKAYINHLMKTKELLAPILLMIHNSHHYLQFFESIRKCIAEDKLPEIIKLVEACTTEEQSKEEVEPETRIPEKTEPIAVVS